MTPPVHIELKGQTCWLSSERCLYWENEQTLILSDLHFGKTGHFRKSGIPVPQQVYREDLQRLMHQIQYFNPRRIIFTGDLFHSRENQEHEWFAKWRNSITNAEIHLVKGNHDSLPDKVYDELGLIVHQNIFTVSPFHFIHDIHLAESPEDHYCLSGHIHPGIRVSGHGKQSLSFPCFYFSSSFGILPAFSRFTGFITLQPENGDQVYAIVQGNRTRQEQTSLVKIY